MKKIISIFAGALLLVSCNSKKANEEAAVVDEQQTEVQQNVADAHNARNSLSYYGVYEGTLPCADCEGIKVKLTLEKDDTFKYEQEYLTNKVVDTKSSFTGKFVWDESGSKIKLEGAENLIASDYFVAESRLFVLDMEGNRIEGALADHYILNQKEVFE